MIFKLLWRRYQMWRFTRGVGKVAKAYSKLTEQTERAALLMEKFGVEWQMVFDFSPFDDFYEFGVAQ